jgi:hypothetical protein
MLEIRLLKWWFKKKMLDSINNKNTQFPLIRQVWVDQADILKRMEMKIEMQVEVGHLLWEAPNKDKVVFNQEREVLKEEVNILSLRMMIFKTINMLWKETILKIIKVTLLLIITKPNLLRSVLTTLCWSITTIWWAQMYK